MGDVSEGKSVLKKKGLALYKSDKIIFSPD